MDILFLLIPLSVVLILAIGAVLWWAMENGQFEDLEGPAHRILMDDDSPAVAPEVTSLAGERGTPGDKRGQRR
jgi:cbb3-type cytochrome oxidase maturation protein